MKRTQFDRRAIAVAGPDNWNSLPPKIRLTELFHNFSFYTFLFNFSFISALKTKFTHGLLLFF